jgi:hypothetical protein
MLNKTRHYDNLQDDCGHSHDNPSEIISQKGSSNLNCLEMKHGHSHANSKFHIHLNPLKKTQTNRETPSNLNKNEIKDLEITEGNSIRARIEKSIPSLILEEAHENQDIPLAPCNCHSHETKILPPNTSRTPSQAELQKSQVYKSRTINIRYQRDFRQFNLERGDFSPRFTPRKSLSNSKSLGTRRHSRLLRNLENYIIHSQTPSCKNGKNYEMSLYNSKLDKKRLISSSDKSFKKKNEG